MTPWILTVVSELWDNIFCFSKPSHLCVCGMVALVPKTFCEMWNGSKDIIKPRRFCRREREKKFLEAQTFLHHLRALVPSIQTWVFLRACQESTDHYGSTQMYVGHWRATIQGLLFMYACIYLFIVVLEFELRFFPLSHSTHLFLWRAFRNRVSQTICPGWLQTVILWSLPPE
jgi:hypothetical protein